MNIITVDRQRFRLELWVPEHPAGYQRTRKYPIAVGAIGHTSPRAAYAVVGKSKTPDWKAPDAEWVPQADRGKIFKFDDPKNPFAGGFISLSGGQGVGIHGTKFDPMVGTRASHGCIRMRTPDLLALWSHVNMDTSVVIF